MPADAVVSLVDSLRDSDLLDAGQLAELTDSLLARFHESSVLIGQLIERGWLTTFQADQLLQGRGGDLVLGPYVLLDLLGRGGMGQVYRARHKLMNRVVALKVIRPDRLASEQMVARFRREIQAVARLSHPNIITAHDAAQVGDTHFFVMEFVEGTDLAYLVNRQGPLPVAQAVDFIRQAALGLQHAHEQGLVHRDVKPANLLVSAKDSVVKLLDLGLVRLARNNDDTTCGLTADGAVIGTPDYMAPDQSLDAHQADIRSDIYSLGCTLYHLLAGRPPFPGGSLMQKLVKHRDIDPVPLEGLRPDVPRGLGDVVRKMMAKRPEDRYQTPAEAAAVLEPFRASGTAESGRFGVARLPLPLLQDDDAPSTASEVFSAMIDTRPSGLTQAPPHKPPRRGLWVAAAVAAILLVGVGAVMAPTIYRIVTNRGLLIVEVDPSLASKVTLEVRGPEEVTLNEEQGFRINLKAGQYQIKAADGGDQFTLSQGTVRLSRNGREVVRVQIEPSAAALVTEMGPAGDATNAQVVPPANTSNRPSPAPETAPVPTVLDLDSLKREDIPAGELAAVGGGDPNNAPEELVAVVGDSRLKHEGLMNRSLAFTVDGKWLVSGGDTSVRVWDAQTGYEVLPPKRFDDGVFSVGVSPDGKHLARSTGHGGNRIGIDVWELRSGRETLSITIDWKRQIEIARRGDGTETRSMSAKTIVPFYSVAFAPQGKGLVAGSNYVKIWETETGLERLTIPANGPLLCMALSSDGTRVAGGGTTVKVWDTTTGQQVLSLQGHDGGVVGVAFSPDGKLLASQSGAEDGHGQLKLWDAILGKELFSAEYQRTGGASGSGVAFSPDGARLASANGHTLAIWDVATRKEVFPPIRYQHGREVIFSPDGKRVFAVHGFTMIRVWDAATGRELMPRRGPMRLSELAFGLQGAPLVVVGKPAEESVSGGITSIYLWGQGNELARTLTFRSGAGPLALSADGQRLATVVYPGNWLLVWDVKTGKQLRAIEWQSNDPARFALSPDGSRLVLARKDAAITISDVDSGKDLLDLKAPAGPIHNLIWVADGKHLATRGDDAVRVWDTTTGQKIREWTASNIRLLALDADGQTLASVVRNAPADATAEGQAGVDEIVIRSAAKGDAITTISEPSLHLSRMVFSPDGKLLAATTDDRRLILWRTSSGEKLKEWRLPWQAIVAFAPDGRHLATGNGNGTAYIFRLPPPLRSLDSRER